MARPDIQGHEKYIRLRPYRASDFDQVRELFKVGILHGSNSPLKVAYVTQLRGPTVCLSYCVFLLGLQVLLVTFLRGLRSCYIGIGITLCITGCTLFAALRLRLFSVFSDHVEKALNSDLKDIDKTYGLESIGDHSGENIGEYIPSGASGFWVAEAYEKASDKTEIIGSVGLDVNKHSDKTSAELRRMVVSPDYRRRNVAKSLILVALQHARDHGVQSIGLSTSMFQPVAIAMYEKFGWVRQKRIGVWIVLDRIWILFYSLDLTTTKA